MWNHKVPATLLLLFFAIEALAANKRKQKDKIIPTVVNVCTMRDRDAKIHCYCKASENPNEAYKGACWVFNGGMNNSDTLWATFTSQSNIEYLEFDVRADGALDFVPTSVFQYMKNLKNFTVQFGSIPKIESYTFANLSVFQEIHLPRNQIMKLSKNSFFNLPNLTVLNLYNNKIKELVPDTFSGLSALQTLNMSMNNIRVIQNGAFNGIPNLENLGLKQNNITELKKECFKGLANLKTLDLRMNKIAVLNSLTFVELWKLHTLMLDHNEIVTLGHRTFDGLSELYKLTLSYNKIVTLIEVLFQGIRGLSILDLRHNKLIKFTYEHVQPIYDNLKINGSYIDLDENELTCDCHLAWMHNLRREAENVELRRFLENFVCKVSVDSSLHSYNSQIKNNSDDSNNIFHDVIDDTYPDEPKLLTKETNKTLLQIPVELLPCPQDVKTVTDKTYTYPSQNEAKDYRNLIQSSESTANNVSLSIFLFAVFFLLRY